MTEENTISILDYFSFKFKKTRKFFYFSCPIHHGDNSTALNIKKDGSYWVCRTHGCQNGRSKGIIGFVQEYIKINEDNNITYQQAKKICEDIIGDKIEFKKKDSGEINSAYLNRREKEFSEVDKNIIDYLEIPSPTYIRRGFSPEILIKYQVGDCKEKTSKMRGRTVFPIYNISGTDIIGYTGRSIYKKCKKCGRYHKPGIYCNEVYKWKHLGFSRESTLYNIWNAKTDILKNNSVILVESPNCVLKLEEINIKNSVAFIGSFISQIHLDILNSMGVMNISLISDKDKAGDTCRKNMMEMCSGLYNIKFPQIRYHDIADCPDDYIRKVVPKLIQC